MLNFWKAKVPRTSKMIFRTVRYTNTQIQTHKYTNTACDEVPEVPNMCYIFEKPRFQGHQKWYSGLSDTQIHKYKLTNTQIQPVMKCQKYPTCVIFLKSQGFKDIKHDILDCQTHKYTNTNGQIHIQIHKKTNTQIQHMTKWQKYPTYAIFFNRWCFKDHNPMCSVLRYTVHVQTFALSHHVYIYIYNRHWQESRYREILEEKLPRFFSLARQDLIDLTWKKFLLLLSIFKIFWTNFSFFSRFSKFWRKFLCLLSIAKIFLINILIIDRWPWYVKICLYHFIIWPLSLSPNSPTSSSPHPVTMSDKDCRKGKFITLWF